MQNIFENKPNASCPWNLRVTLTPGMMENQLNWKEVSINDVEYSVTFNDQCLMSGNGLQEPQTVDQEIQDSKQPVNNYLKIVVSNIHHENHMVKVQIYVQDHCVNGILLSQQCYYTSSGEVKYGSTYMGENGYQCFEIRTPVYQWLFDHELAIIDEISE